MENNPDDLFQIGVPGQDSTAESTDPGELFFSPEQPLYEYPEYTANTSRLQYEYPAYTRELQYGYPAYSEKSQGEQFQPGSQSKYGSSTQGRMPKSQALALVRSLKKALIIASIVAFGVLSGLAASHATGVTASQGPSITNPASPTSPSNSGGFFDQGGGYGFGSGNYPQNPFSGSHVS